MTAAFLSPAWAAEAAAALTGWPDGLPSSAGGPVEVDLTVVGGPDGDVSVRRLLWPDEAGPGREVAFTLLAAEARALVAGTLAPSVAFMRGRLKTSGDPGAALDVLAATATDRWARAQEALEAATAGP